LVFVAEDLPNPSNALGQDRLTENAPWPYTSQQLVFGANLPGVLKQIKENFERLALDLGVDPIYEKLMCAFV
jgi:hypothetical protein